MQAAIDNKEVAFLNPFLNDFPCDVPQTTDQNPSQQLFHTFEQPIEEVTSYFAESTMPQETVSQNTDFNLESISTIISSESDITQNVDDLETMTETQQIQLGCESMFSNFDTSSTEHNICDTNAQSADEVLDDSNNYFNNFSVVHQDSYVEQQESVVVEYESGIVEQESVVTQDVTVERDLLFNTNLDESSENVVSNLPVEGRPNKPGPPPRPPPPSKKPIPIPDEPLMMQAIPGVVPYYPPQPVTLMSLTSPSQTLNTVPDTSVSVAAPTITQIFKTPEQGD